MAVVEERKPLYAVAGQLNEPSRAKSFSAPSSLAPLSQISGYGSALTSESLNAPSFRTGTALAGTDSRETSPALAGAIDAAPRYAGEAGAAPFTASTSSASTQVGQASFSSSANGSHAESAPSNRSLPRLTTSSPPDIKSSPQSLSPKVLRVPEAPTAVLGAYRGYVILKRIAVRTAIRIPIITLIKMPAQTPPFVRGIGIIGGGFKLGGQMTTIR